MIQDRIGFIIVFWVGAGLLGCSAGIPESVNAPTIPADCADMASFQSHTSPKPAANSLKELPSAYAASSFQKAQGILSQFRAQLSRAQPHTKKLALSLREPISGRLLEARGAVALAPPNALRMILLGPGGTTALDLWLNNQSKKFRFSLPALDLLVRGKLGGSSTRGFPVDFLRFWLLRPAEGEFLWYERRGKAERFALRDPEQKDAIVEICILPAPDGDPGKTPMVLRRSSWAPHRPGRPNHRLDEEIVVADGLGCSKAYYTQAKTGLQIQIRCEGEEIRPPNPKAFEDPDALSPPQGAAP